MFCWFWCVWDFLIHVVVVVVVVVVVAAAAAAAAGGCLLFVVFCLFAVCCFFLFVCCFLFLVSCSCCSCCLLVVLRCLLFVVGCSSFFVVGCLMSCMLLMVVVVVDDDGGVFCFRRESLQEVLQFWWDQLLVFQGFYCWKCLPPPFTSWICGSQTKPSLVTVNHLGGATRNPWRRIVPMNSPPHPAWNRGKKKCLYVGIPWDCLLKMFHNAGGDHCILGWGVVPMYSTVSCFSISKSMDNENLWVSDSGSHLDGSSTIEHQISKCVEWSIS